MSAYLRAGILGALVLGLVGCLPQAKTSDPSTSSIAVDGASFRIADAAISSNCLTLAFAVGGYSLPAGALPQHGFPPAKSITIHASSPGLLLDPIPLGGGGGGGGNDEDGRVWMRQEVHYSLGEPVPEVGCARGLSQSSSPWLMGPYPAGRRSIRWSGRSLATLYGDAYRNYQNATWF